MKRFDRRKFMLLASVGASGAVLTACGNDPDDVDLSPTMIPDVPGAPPTLAPNATPGGGATDGDEEDTGGDTGGDANVVTLDAEDPYAWSTKELEAAPGQVIQVTNTGVLEHNFHIDELDIAQDLPPGEPVDITLPDDLTVGDTYTYYCAVPGHREGGMEGTLTIVEAGAAAPAGGEEASPVSGEASPVAAEEEAPAADEGAASTEAAVTTVDLAFEPKEFTIAADTDVTVTITNDGALQHDFTIDELDVASDLFDGGSSGTVTINAPAGTYEFYCSVPGHKEAGMIGTLTVQ